MQARPEVPRKATRARRQITLAARALGPKARKLVAGEVGQKHARGPPVCSGMLCDVHGRTRHHQSCGISLEALRGEEVLTGSLPVCQEKHALDVFFG